VEASVAHERCVDCDEWKVECTGFISLTAAGVVVRY
jgi:hypothetical protein